jgi:hypothetical protein
VNAAEIAAEFSYPLTRPAMVLALVFFWLLIGLAKYAGLYGLFLLLILLPAYIRYLIAILDSRINGREPEPPTVEMFSLVDSLWTLFPLVPVAAMVGIEIAIGSAAGADRSLLGTLPLGVFVFLMPASLAMLTLTRSPLASINPLNLYLVLRRSMPTYLVIPLAMVAVSTAVFGLVRAGAPAMLLDLAISYQLFLFCSLTGAIMHRSELHLEVDIPEPVGADKADLDRRQLRERQEVASHAYGFISRGNRNGGLKHVQDRIDGEADVDGAYQWFFDEMMRWESSDAVLYFAQAYLGRLLRVDMDSAAIRVLTRCLHRNPRFRPLDQDRKLTLELLQKHRRTDLLTLLEYR